MSNLKRSLVALALACIGSSASAGVLYFEDFESFPVGTVLHEIAGWEGWYGDAGTAATVSGKYAFSGSQSLEVDGSADAVQVLDMTEGKWVVTAMQYIPSGTSGTTRFHMQNTYRHGAIGRSVQWFFSLSDGRIGDDYDAGASARIIYDRWIELKLVIDLDNDLLEQYYDGKLLSSRAWVYSGTSQIQSIDLYGNGASSVYYDDIRIQDYLSSLVTAHAPDPPSEATDVPRDVVLAWLPGWVADVHDVYFGTDAEDVADADRSNPLEVLASEGQGENRYDPGVLLEYGRTYYWRVDEVNGPPDGAVFKGDVWSFTVEPFAYPITGLTATASGGQASSPPIRTIDRSGLDDLDQHSVQVNDMWMTPGGLPAWIQYEFEKPCVLDKMLVWNSNQLIEGFLGFGAKNVTIEYSLDGATWTALEGVPEFAKASGMATYTANTTVEFGSVQAQYVKLTINSNHGGIAPQTGLSEVRFFYVPVQAFGPDPKDGATDVGVETGLDWRPGRQATSHTVYIDTDRTAVAEGAAGGETVTDHGHAPSSLMFATQYFWKVDETGDTGVRPGNVWSFTTAEFAAVDDFEAYTDDIEAEETIWQIWIDGLTNGSGSYVGYETARNGTFAETSVVHGGRQSMPLSYDNAKSPYYSEVERTFDSSPDWTAHGADTLSLYFRGVAPDGGNSAEGLYVTVKDSSNQSKTVAHPDAAATTATDWQQWQIPLTEFTSAGVKTTAVKTLVIGVGNRTSPKAGGTGVVYIDDIGYGHPAP